VLFKYEPNPKGAYLMPINRIIATPDALPKLHCAEIDKAVTYLSHRDWDEGVDLLQKMIKKANAEDGYLARFKHFLESDESTLLLRELCEPFGDYMKSSERDFRNSVNFLDTAFGVSTNNDDFPKVYKCQFEALKNADYVELNRIRYEVTGYEEIECILHYKHPCTGIEYAKSIPELRSENDGYRLIKIKPVIFI